MHRETASEMISLPWSQNHRKENAAGYVSPLVFYKMPDQGRGTQQLACLVIYSRWLLDLSPQTIPQMCAGLVWVPGYHSFPHNAICFPHKVERKTCFQFLLGLMIVPWEIENNFYVGKTNCIVGNMKVADYGLCEKGEFKFIERNTKLSS